jgi:hypothetical protein
VKENGGKMGKNFWKFTEKFLKISKNPKILQKSANSSKSRKFYLTKNKRNI